MEEINVLLLEKRGCDFWDDDEEMKQFSDIGNYRVFCKGLKIDGTTTFFDFSRGYKRALIKNKYQSIHQHLLCGDIYQVTIKNNYFQEHGNSKIEKQIEDFNYIYNQKDLLKAVNKINDFNIEKLFIFDNIYCKIEKIANKEEKRILDYCNRTTLIQDDNCHQIFRFYGENNNSFDYDTLSNEILRVKEKKNES